MGIREPAREGRGASLTECARHLFDRRLASLFLRGLLILTALARRDLPDQSEVTALELARRELLRRNVRATSAATSALRATTRRGSGGSGTGCAGAIARPGGTSAAARTGGSRGTTTTAARGGAQRLQAFFELVDLALHFVDVTNDLARRNAAFADHSIDDIRGLSRTQAGRGS